MVKYGKWFPGNAFLVSFDLSKYMKYAEGVDKPTALETKVINGKVYSRFYHKPLYPGEFWD